MMNDFNYINIHICLCIMVIKKAHSVSPSVSTFCGESRVQNGSSSSAALNSHLHDHSAKRFPVWTRVIAAHVDAPTPHSTEPPTWRTPSQEDTSRSGKLTRISTHFICTLDFTHFSDGVIRYLSCSSVCSLEQSMLHVLFMAEPTC